MKRLFNTKRGLALLAVMVVAVSGAVAGYAYFTAGGSGSGTAAVGVASSINITGAASGTLYPGGSVPVTVTISNPGAAPEFVSAFSGSVTSATPTSTGIGTCPTADFSFTGASVGATIPASALPLQWARWR